MHTADTKSTVARIHRAYDKGWWSHLRDVVKHRRVAASLLAVLALSLLGFSLRALLQPSVAYVLVIDSGSTGTRLFAYTWQERRGKLPLLQAVSIKAAGHKVPRKAAGDRRAYERLETEPGLDHFVDDPEGLDKRALRPLLEWAEAVVPRRQWEQTPLFLFGTAGLRKLAPAGQDHLMAAIQACLAGSVFRFEPGWARIISGVDEGVFGWIALNYLTGHLAPHPVIAPNAAASAEARMVAAEQMRAAGPDERIQAASHGLATVGALDLGGSSLEVSFVPSDRPAADAEVNVTIMGVQYSLYTHVHHHYGLNDAFDRSVTVLLAQQHGPAAAGASDQDPRRRLLSAGSLDSTTVPGSHGWLRWLLATGHPPYERALDPERWLLDSFDDSWDGQPALPTQRDTQPGRQDAEYSEPSHPLPAQQQQQPQQQHHAQSKLGNADPQTAPHTISVQHVALASSPLAPSRRRVLQSPPDTALEVAHPCLHEGYDKPYRRMTYNGLEPTPVAVRLVGRPDWQACGKLAAAVVNASASCPLPPCALGTSQPVTTNKFFALTGFYVVYHFFSLPSTAGLAALEAAGRRFCETPWPVVNATRGAEIHVDRYCFRVPYITSLLREGLGVPESRIQIGSGREGWTLGAALAEGSRVGTGSALQISRSQAGVWGSPMAWPRLLAWLLWLCAAAFSAILLVLLLSTISMQTLSPLRVLNRKAYNSSPVTSPTLGSAASLNMPPAGKVYHGGAPLVPGPYAAGLLLLNGQGRAFSMPVALPRADSALPNGATPALVSPFASAEAAERERNSIDAAALSGSFQTNMVRLSGKSQRKRQMSIENLQKLARMHA